jgi:hypothetical protein
LREWKDTQRIAVGGGFRASRVGELVIGRTRACPQLSRMIAETN